MKIKTHKDVKTAIFELIAAGWKVEHETKNHLKIYSPDGLLRTVVGSSLSDYRGVMNIKAQIKRARAAYEKSH